MARQGAMRRKGSFMDDLPPEDVGGDMGGGPMDIDLNEYVPGYEDEMAMGEDVMAVEDEAGFEMEARIASLEDRIAQLEAMLAG